MSLPRAEQLVYLPKLSVLQQYGVTLLPQELLWLLVGGGGGGLLGFLGLVGLASASAAGAASAEPAKRAATARTLVICIFI
jgi:hypothetical protein